MGSDGASNMTGPKRPCHLVKTGSQHRACSSCLVKFCIRFSKIVMLSSSRRLILLLYETT